MKKIGLLTLFFMTVCNILAAQNNIATQNDSIVPLDIPADTVDLETQVIQLLDSLENMHRQIILLQDSIESMHHQKLIPENIKKKIVPIYHDDDPIHFTTLNLNSLTLDSLIQKKPKRKTLSALIFGHWQLKLETSLTANQNYYKNWTAGGDNSLALKFLFRLGFTYSKKGHSWDNYLKTAYGTSWLNADKRFNKTDDVFEFSSGYSYLLKGRWSLFFNNVFLTQFDKGLAADLKTVISNFMAPGYLTTSIGVEYKIQKPKRNTDFIIGYSPAAGKTIFVLDDSIPSVNYGINAEKNIASSLGSLLTLSFKTDIIPQIYVSTKWRMFYGYFKTNPDLDKNVPDVTGEMTVGFRITRRLQASLILNLIYDYKIRFPVLDEAGAPVLKEGKAVTVDKLQFKEVFGLSFLYKI